MGKVDEVLRAVLWVVNLAFRLNIESLVCCLSLRSNAKSDEGCLKVKSERFSRRVDAREHGRGQASATPVRVRLMAAKTHLPSEVSVRW